MVTPEIGHRKYSSQVTEGIERAASRVCSTVLASKNRFSKVPDWHRFDLGHGHAVQHAHQPSGRRCGRRGVENAGGKAMQFNTITISDRWELKE